MENNNSICRFDELGRIAIPNEICWNLKIRKGELREIVVDSEGNIILRKCKKTWEETVLKWWRGHYFLPALKRTEFYHINDYTFCIITNVDGSTIASFAKRYYKDADNDIIGNVAAYARALGMPINKLVGWKG